MIQSFNLIGLNHKTAPLELREEFVKAIGSTQDILKALKGITEECVVLKTCNRIEFYINSKNTVDPISIIAPHIEKKISEHLYKFNGIQLISHLMEVTSSLDSLVIGETQILGQVKDAYEQAQHCGTINKNFHKLFQGAIRAAKEVHSQTAIGQGHVNFSSVSINLCREIWESIDKVKLMVMGSGTMARELIQAFNHQNIHNPLITSRTFEHANDLARQCHGTPVEWSRWCEYLAQSDVLITAFTCDEPVITENSLKSCQQLRGSKPLLIIDISVPRNVATDVDKFENIYRYDLEGLGEIISGNTKQRESLLNRCREILSKHSSFIIRDLEQKDFSQVYQSLNDHLDQIKSIEFDRIKHLIPNEYHDLIEESLMRFGNKLIHPLRKNAPHVIDSQEDLETLLLGDKRDPL